MKTFIYTLPNSESVTRTLENVLNVTYFKNQVCITYVSREQICNAVFTLDNLNTFTLA